MIRLPPLFVAPKYNSIIGHILSDFDRIKQTKRIIKGSNDIHWLIDRDKTEWAKWYYDDLHT